MSSLSRICSDKRLTLNTKSMYHTPVLAVLLYASSRCQDSGCLSPQMPETTSWNMMVRSSLKWRSSATSRPDFTVPSAIHQTHFDLTSIYLQTRLFNFMSVHHLVDLLTVHGVAHLAAPKTSGSTNSRDDSVRSIGDLWRRADGRGHSGAATQQPPLATWMMTMMGFPLLMPLGILRFAVLDLPTVCMPQLTQSQLMLWGQNC